MMNYRFLAKNIIPRSILQQLRVAQMRLKRIGWRFACPICEQKVKEFCPIPSFYKNQLIVNESDLIHCSGETCNQNAYTCPHCRASDRDRLYALYLAQQLCSAKRDFRLLDIAPSRPLSKHIRRRYPIDYRTADLIMEWVDDQIDITRMDKYAEGTFDAVICSHVLEHVPDDIAALRELYRILKLGGWGIVMVPIALDLKEIREDPAKTTDAERWRYFGQGDHVRIYNKQGFLDRVTSVGFRVREFGREYFGDQTFHRHGITLTSVLYVVEKSF